MTILFIPGAVLSAFGVIFFILGALGLLRMPDVFNKLQAGTKATTLGFISVALGVLLMKPEWAPKIILIMIFVLLTNPIGSHALARASKFKKEKMVLKDSDSDSSDSQKSGEGA